ncbi:NADPH-dependent F420 reductase [Haliangium ochraceum]|uniref:NADPH-dependent F420 reductase n=1 Tax=Haliangium ochraceum (strain DSM 14365 / JCM 11303 / SMP-2) TaxID=502025 RepID=D0LGF7_HALO1|nr:NADPH-dependent F420 reductase [Haliangium ochraceum]ACY12703.1 NADPH-dependent F420 reductase [Haliangium ochraceum DSM 14365]
MRIAIVGGTGNEGRGLGLRWARAGHDVRLGSREATRAEACAAELAERLGAGADADANRDTAAAPAIAGGSNIWAIEGADAVVLSVPYRAHASTLAALAEALAGKLLIDITVPLVPPRVRVVHLPEGRAAALEAQERLGAEVRVVAALHHVSAGHLADLDHAVDCDVLVCGDDEHARNTAVAVIGDLGVRALDAGPLRNAIALEALTPVLLHLNRRYRGGGAGLRITGLRLSGDGDGSGGGASRS